MLYPMRTGRRRRGAPLAALLAAFILGAGGAPEPAHAQYPSNFEPYNAYYYSLHAPYYYYLSPASAPSRAAPAAARPALSARDGNWGWWGGGWHWQWGWPRGGGWRGGHR